MGEISCAPADVEEAPLFAENWVAGPRYRCAMLALRIYEDGCQAARQQLFETR